VPGEVPAVLTVARLTPEKQVGQCVKVHARLKAAGIRFRWYVIGTGSEEALLRAEIHRLGLEDDFLLLGNQANVYACMQACDVLALLSSSEGCPTVVLEALTLGRPVIVTDVNGADELIEHEKTGLIVPNDPDAMAAGLARLLQDDSLRRRFREALAEGAGFAAAVPQREDLLDKIEATAPASTPKVSILIPTYNQERFIERAIASALAQDFLSLEIVVIDDASTDGTGTAARAWKQDPRFRYVRNEHNLGRVANYRRALAELARGDWVLLLDGDDFLTDAGFIRRACAALARHADRPIVFAQAGHRVHHLNGQRPDADILPPIDGDEDVRSGADYLHFVFETGFFTHLGALYDRRAALRIGFYTADISSSDMESFFRLALEGEVLLLNTIAGCWVQHGANTSSSLRLADLTPNVRIFSQSARLAVQRGLARWRDYSESLRRYEAKTLLHLFGLTVGKTAPSPLALLRLLGIAFRINPRLLRDRLFLSGCLRLVRPLARVALDRSRMVRLAQRVLGRRRTG